MRDNLWLNHVGNRVAEELANRKAGTPLRMKSSVKIWRMETDGWMCSVAQLPNKDPGLEIWLDRYAAQEKRAFYAGFYSGDEKSIRDLVKQTKKEWPVVLELGEEDIGESRVIKLRKPLQAGKVNAPIAEYYDGFHYFGFYQRMIGTPEKIEGRFCRQAVDFFLDVAASAAHHQGSETKVGDEEIYPRCEPSVKRSHLRRERSRYLGSQCKERDNYQCQVCGMTFEEVYGALGRAFAEAHHKQALATMDPAIPTALENLITVCANCYRMLHRREGKADDVRRLKVLLGKNGIHSISKSPTK